MENKFFDPHNYRVKLAREIEQVKKLDKENREVVLDFQENYSIKNGLSPARQLQNMTRLRHVCEWLNKPLIKFSKSDSRNEDAQRLLVRMNRADYSPYTIQTYIKVLRCWMAYYDRKGFRELLDSRELTYRVPQNRVKQVTSRDLLNRDEKERILRACKSAYYRPFLYALMESGARPEELLTAKVRSLEFDESGCTLRIEYGKTGAREVRLLASHPILLRYVNETHPDPKPDNELFVNERGRPMEYRAMMKYLQQIAKRANVVKRVTPTMIRKSVITELLAVLPQSVVQRYVGHTPGSAALKHYERISYATTNEAIEKARRGAEYRPPKKEKLEAQNCHQCGKEYGPLDVFCPDCRLPLRLEHLLEREEDKRKLEESRIKGLEEKMVELQDMVEILGHKEVHDPKKRRELISGAVEWKKQL